MEGNKEAIPGNSKQAAYIHIDVPSVMAVRCLSAMDEFTYMRHPEWRKIFLPRRPVYFLYTAFESFGLLMPT